jgi:threonine/homoserine/homoserine lactone efflux protein
VAGIETGTLVHTIAAAAGLSALIAASALAFDVVKFCGVGYLLIAGARSIAQKAVTVRAEPQLTVRAAYRRGVFTNVLNPKTALLFVAFLPHFIRADHGHVFLQCIVLGGALSAVGVVVGSAYALTAVLVGDWLRGHSQFERWQQRVSGALLIAIALRLMLVSGH